MNVPMHCRAKHVVHWNVSAFKRNSVEKLASLTIIPIFHKNSKVVTNKFLNK